MLQVETLGTYILINIPVYFTSVGGGGLHDHIAHTTRWPTAGLILAKNRRRWANTSPELDERVGFAGQSKKIHYIKPRHYMPALSQYLTDITHLLGCVYKIPVSASEESLEQTQRHWQPDQEGITARDWTTEQHQEQTGGRSLTLKANSNESWSQVLTNRQPTVLTKQLQLSILPVVESHWKYTMLLSLLTLLTVTSVISHENVDDHICKYSVKTSYLWVDASNLMYKKLTLILLKKRQNIKTIEQLRKLIFIIIINWADATSGMLLFMQA